MKTLAIHPGALGDCILFARLLNRLGGKTTFVGGGQKVRLLTGLGIVERGIDFESLPMHEVFTDTPVEACRLPALLGRCDRLISFFPSADAAAEKRLTEMCGAKEAVFLPVRPPAEYPRHLTELWCERLGVDWTADDLSRRSWSVPPEWRLLGKQCLDRAGVCGRYIVIHPGAGGRDKRWPVEKFTRLAGLLRQELACQIVFVLGPAERDQAAAGEFDSLAPEGAVVDQPDLFELAGLLGEACCYIGNDSGPGHLAAALGISTTVFFGSTKKEHFCPLGPRVGAISGGYDMQIDVREALVFTAHLIGQFR